MQPSVSIVEFKGYVFLIMDAPDEKFEDRWIKILNEHGANTLVCTTERTYPAEAFTSHNISVLDLFFPDGTAPPPDVINTWLALLTGPEPQKCVGIHCLAGLGRAPALVAIALMEIGRMSSTDAILFIREKRPGAISARQVSFLNAYVPKIRNKLRICPKCCIVM